MPPFAALPPHDDVYRAASNQTWIDAERGKFLPDAFKLRKVDADSGSGLSVMVADYCPTLEEAQILSTEPQQGRLQPQCGAGARRRL